MSEPTPAVDALRQTLRGAVPPVGSRERVLAGIRNRRRASRRLTSVVTLAGVLVAVGVATAALIHVSTGPGRARDVSGGSPVRVMVTKHRNTRANVEAAPAIEGGHPVSELPRDASPAVVRIARRDSTHAPRPVVRSRIEAPSPSELAQEVEDYEKAAALGRLAPEQALGLWRDLRRRRPDSALRPEIDLRIIEMLLAVGRSDEAASEARNFLRRHPASPHAAELAPLAQTLPPA